jgi:hypothetical protein
LLLIQQYNERAWKETFDPADFFQVDIVNSGNYSSDLPSGGIQKLHGLNLARSANNALLALRWKPESRTLAQVDAVITLFVLVDQCPSFSLNNVVRLFGPRDSDLANLTKIVYRN